jgi:hypothetical protein
MGVRPTGGRGRSNLTPSVQLHLRPRPQSRLAVRRRGSSNMIGQTERNKGSPRPGVTAARSRPRCSCLFGLRGESNHGKQRGLGDQDAPAESDYWQLPASDKLVGECPGDPEERTRFRHRHHQTFSGKICGRPSTWWCRPDTGVLRGGAAGEILRVGGRRLVRMHSTTVSR